MQESVSVLCPAKINLGLKVFDRRQDGFHDLESIFTTIPLFDRMTVSVREEAGCVVECAQMALPEENTISLAYKAFCVLTGIQKGVHVILDKCIPAGGGLGGGSSDASSFLKSIDSIFHTQLGLADFMQLSSLVGSDVFFFTKALDETDSYQSQKVYTALVEGRGEKVRTIPSRKDFSILLLLPEVSVSTKEAYGVLDKFKAESSRGAVLSDIDLEEEWEKQPHNWCFKNDFTVPVCSIHPELKIAIECLQKTGADFVDMSGSGSTLFAIFEDRNRAAEAERNLSGKYRTVLL